MRQNRWVDFGSDIGILQTSAQITVHYQPEDLIGKKVIGYVNLGEKNIAGFMSQFLLVGFSDPNDAICLATLDGAGSVNISFLVQKAFINAHFFAPLAPKSSTTSSFFATAANNYQTK